MVDFDGVDPTPPFIGLANFTEMFTDPEVWHALGNNVDLDRRSAPSAPMVIGLLIAAAALVGPARQRRSTGWCFFLPFVLPGVAIGIVWGWIYDPVSGWLNRALGAVGLGGLQRGWLGDPDTALYAVLATAIWGGTAAS